MSGIWPFFNSSFSNASINKILAEIDVDQQKRDKRRRDLQAAQWKSKQQRQEQQEKLKQKPLKKLQKREKKHGSDPKPATVGQSAPSVSVTGLSQLSQASAQSTTSKEVAVSPPSRQFNVTASQLLHSIKENDTSIAQTLGKDTKTHEKRIDSDEKTFKNEKVESSEPASSVEEDEEEEEPEEEGTEDNAPINIALFNKLLDQPNLMDEINLAKNQRLINYISSTDVIGVMIDFILYSLELSKLGREPKDSELSHGIFTEYDTADSNEPRSGSSGTVGVDDQPVTGGAAGFSDDSEAAEQLTPLEKALQRASVCSEIMILPNTNILENLIGSRELMVRLWRGFFDRDSSYFFKGVKLIEKEDTKPEGVEAKPAEKVEASDSSSDSSSSVESLESSSSPSSLTSSGLTDLNGRPLIDEEQYERSRFKENHGLLLLNNFLKLVDDMATMNMNELMNFIRFEQDHCSLTDQFLRLIPYSPTSCDLLVRLISTDKPYNPNGLIDLFLDQSLILRLFRMAKRYYLDHQVQDNLCNLLNGIVGISSNVGFWDDPSLANGGGGQQLNEFGEPVDADQANMAQANNPNVGPNDLTRQLVSKPCMDEMLDILVNYGHYGLVTVVSVIIEVIRKNNSDYDEFDWIGCCEQQEKGGEEKDQKKDEGKEEDTKEDADKTIDADNTTDADSTMPSSRDPIYLGIMLKVLSLHLKDIVKNYLTDSYLETRKVRKTTTANGDVIEPLGYERFKVMELIAELLHCSNMVLMNKSLKLDRLVYERDLMRDLQHTENLVKDALNDRIGDDEEDKDKEQINGIEAGVKKLSLQGTAEPPYVTLPSDLSIGNFFKLQLLETNAVPLIALKMHRFPWNNFMHNVVFDLVQQIFNGRLANWDEDQASNQEETPYDDNLSLNKVLIWSLFGDFSDFEDDSKCQHCVYTSDPGKPGFFNLPAYILFCYQLSAKREEATNFKLGYMGHLTLIAEEVHKFQNYVENFGMARDDQTFTLLKEESDSSSVFYLKSSFFVFNTLYERIFESGRFDDWNAFVNTTLKELNSMYNKVLGNPNDLGPGEVGSADASDSGDAGSSSGDSDSAISTGAGPSPGSVVSEDGIPISPPPVNENAIILDNGDSDEFRSGVKVIEGEEMGEEEEEGEEQDEARQAGKRSVDDESPVQASEASNAQASNAADYSADYADYADYNEQLDEDGLSGGNLRPMRGHHGEPYNECNDSSDVAKQ